MHWWDIIYYVFARLEAGSHYITVSWRWCHNTLVIVDDKNVHAITNPSRLHQEIHHDVVFPFLFLNFCDKNLSFCTLGLNTSNYHKWIWINYAIRDHELPSPKWFTFKRRSIGARRNIGKVRQLQTFPTCLCCFVDASSSPFT